MNYDPRWKKAMDLAKQKILSSPHTLVPGMLCNIAGKPCIVVRFWKGRVSVRDIRTQKYFWVSYADAYRGCYGPGASNPDLFAVTDRDVVECVPEREPIPGGDAAAKKAE